MTVLTVFRSRLRADAYAAGYGDRAEAMLERARAMPGFVSFKSFTSDDGERVSVIEFDTPAHQEAWANDAEHRVAQDEGVKSFYDEYRITVAEVVRDHNWRRD